MEKAQKSCDQAGEDVKNHFAEFSKMVEIGIKICVSHLAKVSLNGTDPVLMVGERYRRFTPREAANIQSFPLTFTLDSVSENRQYRAIGNAVPPVLMWHIANALVNSCVYEEVMNEEVMNEEVMNEEVNELIEA